MPDMSPSAIAARLEELGTRFAPLDEAEARLRMQAPRTNAAASSVAEVARRLDELRALCELSDYLHAGTVSPSSGRSR
jgi:hypothetical protein